MEFAMAVAKDQWELAPQDIGLPNPLQERRVPFQFGAVTIVRVEDPNRKPEVLSNDSHGFGEI
jgi:hypothetical protein